MLNAETVDIRHPSQIIGDWGPWQKKIFLFYTSLYIISAFQNIGISFQVPKVDFVCKAPPGYENVTGHNHCLSYDDPAKPCTEFVYDKSVFKATATSEWNLVCDRSWLASAVPSVYQIGYAVSAIMLGILSDKYGRLPVFKFAILLEIVAGFSQALSVNIYHFLISRFFIGIAAYGRFLTGLVLILECVGPKVRAQVSVYVEFGWVIGYLMVPVVAYFIAHFRFLQLTVTVSEIFWLLGLWGIPESPRWQLANGHYDEAKVEMTKAAKRHGDLSDEEIERRLLLLKAFVEKEEKQKRTQKKETLFDLLKVTKFLIYSMILYFTWFVNAFVYYGVSLNVGDLGGNLFINFFIFGVAELLSDVFLIYAIQKFGRKSLLILFMFGGGLACIAIIPFSFAEAGLPYRVAFGMIGKFFITSSYHVIYLYSVEIYPTTMRQIGVGSCSVAARVGSVTAPFVKELSIRTHLSVSMGIFAILSLIDGIVAFVLPETKGKDIPDTLAEADEEEQNKS